jgi:hypothetical protein
MKYFSAITALLILLCAGLACSDGGGDTKTKDVSSAGSIGVEEITLKNAADETVTSFKPSDKTQKVSVKFSEANPGKVKGVFTAVDAGGEKNFKVLEKEIEIGALMNTANFTATIDAGFPAGDYTFDLYVNDKLMKTHNYKVQ